jgi:hypothetical protein
MSTWILIIIMYKGGPAAIEFDSKAACVNAHRHIVEHGPKGNQSIEYASCHRK